MPEERRRTSAPTIRDVAERAGVSKSLVSLVLNDSPRVRPQKRDAVLTAIRELGYRPNMAARSLTEGRTRTVGVLINDLRNPWFVDTLDGINAELHARDMTMLLGDARLDRRADERLVTTFMNLRVDGLIVVGSIVVSESVVEAARMLPTVVAGAWDLDQPRVDVSVQDDRRGAELAARHLIDLDHRRIGLITGGFGAVMRRRREGYEEAMRTAGLECEVEVVTAEMTERGGFGAALALLDRPARPTAVFVAADVAAVGALRAAAVLGLDVPRDVSIVGFDNTRVADLPGMALTTIDIESERVGRAAVELLVARIASPKRRRVVRMSTASLVVRGTTGPAPR